MEIAFFWQYLKYTTEQRITEQRARSLQFQQETWLVTFYPSENEVVLRITYCFSLNSVLCRTMSIGLANFLVPADPTNHVNYISGSDKR
jgi:hypothetical protein